MLQLCRWLEHTTVGSSVRESLWLFPVIETVHLLGMTLLVGTVTTFDLRLLGLTARGRRVSELGRKLLPWSCTAFALQVLTGALLFSSEAIKVYTNPAFRWKMLLILLAGVQVMIFRATAYRRVDTWDEGPVPVGARIAGGVSLVLWVGVVAAGRFIGFV